MQPPPSPPRLFRVSGNNRFPRSSRPRGTLSWIFHTVVTRFRQTWYGQPMFCVNRYNSYPVICPPSTRLRFLIAVAPSSSSCPVLSALLPTCLLVIRTLTRCSPSISKLSRNPWTPMLPKVPNRVVHLDVGDQVGDAERVDAKVVATTAYVGEKIEHRKGQMHGVQETSAVTDTSPSHATKSIHITSTTASARKLTPKHVQ